jgi:hypothetical protein
MKRDNINTVMIVVMILVYILCVHINNEVKAAPEFNHPKMTCDFIYYHDDEQDIIRRCYDEQKEVICYISEDFKSISCMPAR